MVRARTWMEICVGEVRMRLGFVLYFTGEIFGEVRMCLGFVLYFTGAIFGELFCKWGGVLLVLVN